MAAQRTWDPQWLQLAMAAMVEVDPRHLVQSAVGLTVRWFRSGQIELQVWQDAQGQVDHFQFIIQGQALLFDQRRGFAMGRSEQDLRGPGMMPASELIQLTTEADGVRNTLILAIEQSSIEPGIRDKILSLLRAWPGPPDAQAGSDDAR